MIAAPHGAAIQRSVDSVAVTAGVSCMLGMVIVMTGSFAVQARLIAGNAEVTARNIVANDALFRFGALCGVAYAAMLIVLLSTLYTILKPVNANVALIAAAFRFAYANAWLLIEFNSLSAMRIVRGENSLGTFESKAALVQHALASNHDAYYIGLLFYALASTICACLFARTQYIPRWLATYGVVASLWCAATTLVYLVFPSFRTIVNWWLFDSPMSLFEMVASVWLIVKGLARRVPAEGP